MNDAVWSFHLNPMTCGVAKFGHQLAARLDVPFEAIGATDRAYPLISVKPSEMPGMRGWAYTQMDYDLFLHDFHPDCSRDVTWAVYARKVYAANELIALAVERCSFRAATVAWCPSLVQGCRARGTFRVVLFGMGHKRQPDQLKRLKKLLDASKLDYTVEVSTGIHEGTPWDRAWQDTETQLRGIFGARLRLLGYLADDALLELLASAHLAAVFYPDGVRANNTTVWTALESGVPVLTNLDAASPLELVHGQTVLDLAQTSRLSTLPLDLIATAGQRAAKGRSWARLLSVMVA